MIPMTMTATTARDRSLTTHVVAREAAVSATGARHALIWSIGFIAAFLIGDMTLSRTRLPIVYGSRNGALTKCEQYAKRPAAVVLFIGCSYEWCAINPHAVSDELETQFGICATGFNLSSSASSALTELLVARRVLDRKTPPKIAYLGVNPAVLDSSRHWWLVNGLRALGDHREVELAAHGSFALLTESVCAAMFQSYRKWDDVRLIGSKSMLGAPLDPPARLLETDAGWAKWTGPKWIRTHASAFSGNLAVPQTQHGIPSFGGDFSPDGINAIALRNAVILMRKNGVEARLIETPIAATGPIEEDPRFNAPYRELINRLSEELQIEVLRPPHDLVPPEHFFDPVHMDAEGADIFSRWLARDIAKLLSAQRNESGRS